jgi:hypothetical protein
MYYLHPAGIISQISCLGTCVLARNPLGLLRYSFSRGGGCRVCVGYGIHCSAGLLWESQVLQVHHTPGWTRLNVTSQLV